MTGRRPAAPRLRLVAVTGRCAYCRGFVSRSTARAFPGKGGRVVAVHVWHEVRPGEGAAAADAGLDPAGALR
ncbi:hypothetical protein [Kitasatospora sp. NBC_00315]|uniref:hypothetical protein n=1 Tax=Kitasatospora sp. NBC_00315 TaxID=2975963 RepID=UPI00324EC6B4